MAGRKDNGDGSITERADGRWEARVTLPDGKRKSLYGKTKAEVKEKLKGIKRDIDLGLPVIHDKQTVGQFMSDWIIVNKPNLRYSSWRSYNGYIVNHITPFLGRISLKKLTPQQVQLFYAHLLEDEMSSTTVHIIHSVLKNAMKEAMRLGFVQRNVLDLVKAPRVVHHEMVTLNEEQVNQFLKEIEGDWFEALYILAITTGMREGELLGLRWQDIDFDKGSLLVRMSQHLVNSRPILDEVKTGYSRRRIALTQMALDALRRHRSRQNEWRLSLGAVWDSSIDLVFPNTVGRLMSPSDVRGKQFKKHLQRLNFPDMRFHDLRHTCATLLLSRGVNVKVVSEMLGHSDISITLRVYGHVLPHMQDKAVSEMDSIINQSFGELSSNLSSKTQTD